MLNLFWREILDHKSREKFKDASMYVNIQLKKKVVLIHL